MPQRYVPFGLGAIVMASLFGGPLAAAYLVIRNATALGRERTFVLAIGFYVGASIAWLWALYNVPGDVLSELAVHLPQVVVWCLFSYLLLRRSLSAHKASGGSFRSAWVGFVLGVAVSIALRVVLRFVVPVFG
ncbi:hypothetical protein [Ideonella sp. BN130291]|uniref:hypothetical protein n=1 Tax=Ideonella sp. BN130291 TaxID=3112940 RepID=UPI002E263866|nr:hypothetical protein [Ideonella sp. BN130291]